MGLEQILLPILGGVASGVTTGLEEKRREKAEADARRNAETARTFYKNPELYETPEFRNWANKYFGKDEAKAYYSAARIKKLQSDYDVNLRRQGILESSPIPADQIPPEPVFNDQEQQRGGIMGMLSRFGSGWGGGQGSPQAQPSTGPASGPQGYPPPGGWQATQPSVVNTGGPTPPFTPVNAAGGAAPLVAQMGMDQRIGVPAVSRIPTTKIVSGPGGRVTISGITTGAAPSEGRQVRTVNQLAEGVTETINKDGLSSFTFKKTNPNLSTPMELSQQIDKLSGGSGDLDDAVAFKRIWDGARDIEQLQAYNKVLFQTQAEGDPNILAVKERIEERLTRTRTKAAEEAKTTQALTPESRQVTINKQIDESEGKLLGLTTPVTLADGTKTTVSAQEANQHKLNAAAALKGGGMTEGGAKMVQTSEALVDALGELARLYKPEYVGKIYGRNWYRDLQDVIGTMTGEQAQFWQAYAMARNLRAQQLMGASISITDAERIADEMFDPTNSPTSFTAKVQGFDRAAKNTMVRNRELLGLPREESLAPRPNTPPPAATTPPPAATRPAPTPVPVPAASARKPPINKDKTSKYYGQPMNTDLSVPLNDRTATKPIYQLPASAFGPNGKLLPEVLEELKRGVQAGELPEDFDIETLPDDEFNQQTQGAK